MAENYVLVDDIIKNHNERMLNLRRFYPFFTIMNEKVTVAGADSDDHIINIDMGYITLAVLRFLINENNFHEREASKRDITRFIEELLRRDYGIDSDKEEMNRITDSIFDKLTNGGKAFSYSFFDPAARETKTAIVRLIEPAIHEDSVSYLITEEGIEFYLSTKELHDESRISTDQLLLEKMIKSENYKGGIDVINRINLEVVALHKKRDEVVQLLIKDVRAGSSAADEFMDSIARWFEEERKSFSRNRELVDKAIERGGGAASKDITRLETLLKTTIDNHSRLIKASAELSRFTDEMIHRNRIQVLRNTFDFGRAFDRLRDEDRADGLECLVMPLLGLRKKKSFFVPEIDIIARERTAGEELTEKKTSRETDLSFRYDDEILSGEIGRVFSTLFKELAERLEKKNSFTLGELNYVLEVKFGHELYRNRNYYSYLVHLAGKDRYSFKQITDSPETFLEQLVAEYMDDEDKKRFGDLRFTVSFRDEELIIRDKNDEDAACVTDLFFEKC